MSYLKFLQKYFKSQSFGKNGYVYKFNKVTDLEDFENAYKFYVTASLPKEGQSYSAEKMSQDLNNIIRDSFNFIGQDFSYSLNLSLDTEKEGDYSPEIYVTPEKQKEILERLNRQFSVQDFKFNDKETKEGLIFKLYFFNPELFDEKMFSTESAQEEIICTIYFKVTDIKLLKDGNISDIKPNPNKLNELAGTLGWKIHQTDVSTRIGDLVYEVLEDEIQIGGYEIFYVASLYCKFIDNMKVESPDWNSNDFRNDMFIF